jgi:hypothetical protein
VDGQAPNELQAFPPASDPVGAFARPATPATNNTPPLPSYAGGSVPSSNKGASTPPAVDPTREYVVTPAQGPWMICVTYYTGPDAPAMAVQLVQELRNNYKLPAYIFNYGAEERRKEMERVAQLVQKQREGLKQMNLAPDATTKIRVRHMRIEEQCGVLVGGYKEIEAAKRAVDAIRKLPTPDANHVKLHEMFIVGPKGNGEKVAVNPFTHSFVARNPTVPAERPATQDTMDVAALAKLNACEPLSLLQCSKRYTLAITQLQTPTIVQPQAASGSFLESLGFGSKGGSQEDAAAKSAHNFAEALRKVNQEAYVLHTKYSSIVTVGGYDSAEDPRLKHDQERLNTFLNSLHLQQWVRLFPQPMPMAVPR